MYCFQLLLLEHHDLLCLITAKVKTLLWTINRVVHGSHFWLIFGSFSTSFLDHFHCLAVKWWKNETKNEPKNGYRERSETQISRKWSKNAFCMDFGFAGSTRHIQTPLRKTWWKYISKSIHLPHDSLTLFTSLFIKFRVHLYFQVTYSWLAILFTSLFRVQNKLKYVLPTTKITTKKRYKGAHTS